MSSHTLNTNTCSLSLSFSLSPLWLYLAENLTMCVLKFLEQVFDKDVGQDEKLGVAKVRLIELEAERSKELELRLLPSHDMLKIKDKKDRGTITIQVIIYIHETIIYMSRWPPLPAEQYFSTFFLPELVVQSVTPQLCMLGMALI